MNAVALDHESVEAVARRVAELLRGEPTRALVDAATLAAELGVSRAFVYEHSAVLGAQRLGDGSRARLRFDLATARAAMDRYSSGRSVAPITSNSADSARRTASRRRRSPIREPKVGSILSPKPQRS